MWQLTTDLRFSLEEVAGSLALLTSKGMTSEAAFSGIQVAFEEMLNPLSKINAALEEAGICDHPSHGRNGCSPQRDATKPSNAMMTQTGLTVYEVFGSQKAAAVFGAMMGNMGDLETTMQQLTMSSGEMAGQWANHTQTSAFQWEQFKIRVQNSPIQVGQILLPWIEENVLPWATELFCVYSDDC